MQGADDLVNLKAELAALRAENESLKQALGAVPSANYPPRPEDEKPYATIFESVTDGLIVNRLDGAVADVNQAACDMHGFTREEFLQLTPADFIHPDSLSAFAEYLRKGSTREKFFTEAIDLRKDGSAFDVEVRGQVIQYRGEPHLLGVVRDITDRKKREAEQRSLQEKLAQSQRVESIGRLAGGVAHDFNNLLTVMLGGCEIIDTEPEVTDAIRAEVQQIKGAAMRAADLTRQLLAFARKQLMEPRVVSLNRCIDSVVGLLNRVLSEDIALNVRLGSAWMARVDPVQIEQVVMNLAINARDAMPQGGELTMETQDVSIHRHRRERLLEIPSGEYVRISIRDTGTGMDAHTQQHLFEPFFTTKEVGEGNGLGLATCHGIVTQSRGYINVQSELGKGTTFEVYLPRVYATEQGVAQGQIGDSLQGSETVLLVEDEMLVRRVSRQTLESLGYQVLEAENGDEAMEIAQDRDRKIDILVTDVVLRRSSGPQTAARLQAEFPDLRVLYVSGYTADVLAPHGMLEEHVNFLRKPYTRDSLGRALRRVLA